MRKDEITVEVVACLIAEQFPQWAELPVRPVDLDGWDNTSFRLGAEMSVRLPSHKVYVPQIDKEHRWLPVLGPQLPLPIPEPIAKGAPGCGFPASWSIYRWLPGEPMTVDRDIDLNRLAGDIGGFLAALYRIDPTDGPPAGAHSHNRGGPVTAWDEQTRATLELLRDEIDVARATEVWQAAIASAETGPDVWVHGDVTGSNLLVADGLLCGVIDFGCSAVGDPACDLTPAWTMFSGASRDIFREAVSRDEGTWARARGWALWKALIAIPNATPGDAAASGLRFGWRRTAREVVDEVIADHQATSD